KRCVNPYLSGVGTLRQHWHELLSPYIATANSAPGTKILSQPHEPFDRTNTRLVPPLDSSDGGATGIGAPRAPKPDIPGPQNYLLPQSTERTFSVTDGRKLDDGTDPRSYACRGYQQGSSETLTTAQLNDCGTWPTESFSPTNPKTCERCYAPNPRS